MQSNKNVKKKLVCKLEETMNFEKDIQQDISMIAREITDSNQNGFIEKLKKFEKYDTKTQNKKMKEEAINLVKIAGHKHQKIVEMGEIIEKMKK